MRVEIRERPYDLYAVLVSSTLLVMIILINELTGFEAQAVRVAFGLPFILLFPGYVLISALYPEKKRYYDRTGDPISKEEWEKIVEGNEESEDEEGSIPDGKGLDNLERWALSMGLSIAITPLIGLVLNYTYDWGGTGGFGNEYLGIRLLPILFSIYAFIMITGIVAIRRRLKTALEDRFEFIIDASIPEDYSTMDKVLTVGIVIMMIASVSLLVYIIVVPREGEAFTELYILGPDEMAENYPRNMFLQEEKYIVIGVGNHEHKRMNYTMVLTISPEADNKTVSSLDHVTISRTMQPSTEITVGEDRTIEIPCNFSILETGAFKLRILLFRDNKEYRDVHLWIKVFNEHRLAVADDGNTEVYLTDYLGDPSGLGNDPPEDGIIGVGVGIRNLEEKTRTFKVLISDGSKDGQTKDENMDNGTVIFQEGRIHSFELLVNSTSSLDVYPFILDIGSYRGPLVIEFDTGEDVLTTYVFTNWEV